MLKPDEDRPFFDRERDRLTGEIGIVRPLSQHPLTPTPSQASSYALLT